MLEAKLFRKTFCRYCHMTKIFGLMPFYEELEYDVINVDCNNGKDIDDFEEFCREMWGRKVTPLVKIKDTWFGGPSGKMSPIEYGKKMRKLIKNYLDEMKEKEEFEWQDEYKRRKRVMGIG